MRHITCLAATLALVLAAPAYAQSDEAQPAEDTGASTDGTFTLGQIVVTARPPEGLQIGGETLKADAIYTFNRNTLDDAANLIPGVTAGNSGGSRNERLLFVRGFDRFQVPLSIDGIRIYLPADNRLDFGRFLTPDIAELQVAKGYASVLDGPGAMGGAVNLVTRKPTKEIEAEVRGTLNLGRDAEYTGYNVFALLGTKHDQWYAQASYARNFQDHWDLPGSFKPTVNENGGERDFSRTEDWRVNVKAGFTPNATDEYAISYTKQEGSKNAPLHITDTSNASLHNWSWPYWNIEGVYFLSTTALSDTATVKTRAYWNKYKNLLSSWDNRLQNSQALPRAFNSPYDDTAYGGSAELAVKLAERDTLSVAFHYRHDEHTESQTSRPGFTTPTFEPVQTSEERTWSAAIENRFAFTPALSMTVGASYDWRDTDRAEEFGVPLGQTGANRLFSFPLRNASGWNAQGRLEWVQGATALHASVSSRIRFPTLFERFSSQFGTALPNPNLKPERATNFEVGGSHSFGPIRLEGALFYSHLTDALVSVIRTDAPLLIPGVTTPLNQRQNIGSADYYGGEISLSVQLTQAFQAGVNYSYIHRTFDVGTPAIGTIRNFKLTDVPSHKGFAYLSWQPLGGLKVTPNLEFASGRTTVTPVTANANNPFYYQTGGYVTAGLRADYDINDYLTIGVGGRNLFDKYYVLTDGFPEQGRSFFASVRAKY
ncbi:TonB-dependent receptor [Novosphingobium sp. G106]|uniref:TonB-dependent receptor plug domain-containing protein n=1 Tax=Novosphingobium sp. G106 TaxID=2849500 RepID=UPI001C2DB76C|nr:TonB-dependent receptor [Novosphingobium sp. G106]MBV1687133.1 TonB-dependent receptor [Novosphingobium sp. G106]